MPLPVNQQEIITTAAKLLDDIFSQFGAAPQDVETAIVTSLQAASTARNGAKASGVQIVGDCFALASAVADEIGDPKVSTLINDIQSAEQAVVAGKILPAVADIIAVWKAAKAVA